MENSIYSTAKILAVDDVEEVLISTKNTLKFEGMDVVCISNPEEALEYLRNNKVDVLLLDFFMPQMNGDKFVEKLRQFNQETVVVLRTGYADRVPPEEMLDLLNIQGYIDKLKGDEELILLTKSAIKTSFLYKQLIEQQRQISLLEYQNEFYGKFLYQVLGEIRERAMVIGGLSKIMTDNGNQITLADTEKYAQEINEAIGKLQNVANTLELENLERIKITISRLQRILMALFELDLKVKEITLNINYTDDVEINCDSKILIYIIVDIIQYLISRDVKEINIDCENNLDFRIMNVFPKTVVDKIQDIINKSNESIEVTYNADSLIIHIEPETL